MTLYITITIVTKYINKVIDVTSLVIHITVTVTTSYNKERYKRFQNNTKYKLLAQYIR